MYFCSCWKIPKVVLVFFQAKYHFCGMDHQKSKFLLILAPFLSEAVEKNPETNREMFGLGFL